MATAPDSRMFEKERSSVLANAYIGYRPWLKNLWYFFRRVPKKSISAQRVRCDAADCLMYALLRVRMS